MKKMISTLAIVAIAVVAFAATAIAAPNQWSSIGGGMTSYSGFSGHGASGSIGGFYAGAGSRNSQGSTLVEGQGSIRANSMGNGQSVTGSQVGLFSNAEVGRNGARSNSGVNVNSTTASRGSVTATNVISGSAGANAWRHFFH